MSRIHAAANGVMLLAFAAFTVACAGADEVVESDQPEQRSKPCAQACPAEQTCREGICQAPVARVQQQADSITRLVDELARNSAWHQPVAAPAVIARERAALIADDGSNAAFFGAAWRALNAFPQGHQSMLGAAMATCSLELPHQVHSRFGVCGRPSSAGLAVTVARKGNLLNLDVGDVVIGAGGDVGEAIFEAAYMRPVCGTVFPSKSGRRTAGAASFFGNVAPGTKLTVLGVNGTRREIIVPNASDDHWTNCNDPFGRAQGGYPEVTIRPDGVAVIRLSSLSPPNEGARPTTPQEIQAYIDGFQSKVAAIFATVKTAPAIVWDIRGNLGGISPVGMAIVGGFSSARSSPVSYCLTRTAGTRTLSFEGPRYAEYSVSRGGPFAYPGRVAVITDGLTYSAGDYMAHAASVASNVPLVGSPTAGAYGGMTVPLDVPGPPALTISIDTSACVSARGTLLEGTTAPVTVAVEYDPADLAAGRDTLLEAAVAAAR